MLPLYMRFNGSDISCGETIIVWPIQNGWSRAQADDRVNVNFAWFSHRFSTYFVLNRSMQYDYFSYVKLPGCPEWAIFWQSTHVDNAIIVITTC